MICKNPFPRHLFIFFTITLYLRLTYDKYNYFSHNHDAFFVLMHKRHPDGTKRFNIIIATFYKHYDEIQNFYNNRSSNAAAESFNAKIKLFRANLRGVTDKRFFLFRIAMLYGHPH